ncbi:hypothetical protein FHR92_004402 [Fontibacillus solani]|uniref:Uncharacterized protein n=1 Tax=Fontibacillus solani TaxID=1572857 RepID=A0A7W3SX81_9BACL|nr:hypothetical protein [Fontibacillus solani]
MLFAATFDDVPLEKILETRVGFVIMVDETFLRI